MNDFTVYSIGDRRKEFKLGPREGLLFDMLGRNWFSGCKVQDRVLRGGSKQCPKYS